MKKIIMLLAALIIIIGGTWWYKQTNAPEKTIKIGIMAPLSGKMALRGESTRQGLQLALEKIEAAGLLKEYTLELVYQDVPFEDAKRAPGALSQLADVEHVAAIIGPLGSSVVAAVSPLIDGYHIPMVVHAASARSLTEGNEYMFRLWPTDKSYANTIRQQLVPFGYERIAALTAVSDNTIDLHELLSEDPGFAAEEKVSTDDTDFKTQLTKLKAANPDALFINLHVGQIGVAARQAKDLGIDVPIFTNSVASVTELEAALGALEGAWFPEFAGLSESAQQEFIGRFGQEPGNPDNAAAAHDALLAIAEAISEVGPDPAAIKAYLYGNEFSGAIGTYRFEPNGDAVIPLRVNVIAGEEVIRSQ